MKRVDYPILTQGAKDEAMEKGGTDTALVSIVGKMITPATTALAPHVFATTVGQIIFQNFAHLDRVALYETRFLSTLDLPSTVQLEKADNQTVL